MQSAASLSSCNALYGSIASGRTIQSRQPCSQESPEPDLEACTVLQTVQEEEWRE